MNTATTRTFRLGLMVEEKDLPAIHDPFNALEDELNAIAEEEKLPIIYATLDLRNYAAADSLEVEKGKVILHLCLQDMALADFRVEVVKRLTEQLEGVENIPKTLIDKMQQLGQA